MIATMSHAKIAMVGVGRMGESILAGLLKSGHDPAGVVAVVRRPERRAELEQAHGIVVEPLERAVHHAHVVVVGVKPHQVAGVLDEITPHIHKGTLVVSLAAGIATETLESHLPGGTPVVRVMPNTPSLVGRGMSGISGGRHATPEQVDEVRALMMAVGGAVVVPESQLDALTAVSGSGPAYVFAVAEAMVDAAVQLGLPRPLAQELTTQTIVGAGAMLAQPGAHPGRLREDVTSPGGTTAQALRVFDEYRLRAAFSSAMLACHDRSVELGQANA